MAPWNLNNTASPSPDIYPEYEKVAGILRADGLVRDFSSEGPLRSIHRQDGKAHFYFVANTSSETVKTECSFRVTGLQPELWDPVTGSSRDLPGFRHDRTTTTLPLEFAGHQSYFVVFRSRTGRPSTAMANFASPSGALALGGSWEVSFDPAWGGPERITFALLEDWTKRTEPGIRYYSGMATYRKQFSVSNNLITKKLRLDLGKVNVMATIRINGRELGTLWCAPWQVEVPAKLLKAEGNQLEIVVANLWPNRLIGDAALPAEQRRTWTTSNPYKPGSPLLPSGLLGPVSLVRYE
jgi:hypothetical protein